MIERSAIEALRAGVPNRSAIRFLGTNEDELRNAFLERMSACRSGLSEDRQPEGLILAGGFGAGKSHMLGYMRELALQEDFVVSLVPISKETPLFDTGKLYAAAVRNAVVPDKNDDVMTAVLSRLKPKSDAYNDLEVWASESSGMSPIFAALLYLIPRKTPEEHASIARFLGGGKLGIAVVKQWLREVGAARSFPELRPVKAGDLAQQLLRFTPRLFRAAGYAGWCVLLDEVELIARYSALQRGRSYAELAKWLALSDGTSIPGLLSVCAITNEFTSIVIHDRRDDELIPEKLELKGLSQAAGLCRIGLRALDARQKPLRQPGEQELRASLERVRRLYEDAYAWVPPEIAVGEIAADRTMRQYIKSWITVWDIERLYQRRAEIATTALPINYDEAAEIEQAPDADTEEDSSA
jgi:hypothetical protein